MMNYDLSNEIVNILTNSELKKSNFDNQLPY